MTAAQYSSSGSFQDLDGTRLFFDRPNSRVKILNHRFLSGPQLDRIKTIAGQRGLGKIISFSPESSRALFVSRGFAIEGTIKGFFRGRDALCCSFFVDRQRNNPLNCEVKARSSTRRPADRMPEDQPLTGSYTVRDAVEHDIPGMIALFRDVFETYPSPVFDQGYIRENMRTGGVHYKVAVDSENIVGIASAEKDHENLNAEMTDCATSPRCRGRGILKMLLQELEGCLAEQGFICLYTLCRAAHPPINKAFMRLGYSYSGCLVRNCHICGSFEDMNILVKLIN